MWEIKSNNNILNILNNREPLGKKMNRKYEFPEEVHQNNFLFGQKIGGCNLCKLFQRC